MPLLQSSHWPFLIDVYFLLGGVAGGAFVIATVANLLDHRRYAQVVRVGYYLALLALLPCPLLLIIDLGVPSRFMNMMLHWNRTSPMSMGSWALGGFSVCAFLAALFTLMEDTGKARDLRTPKVIVGLIGGFFGFFLAAYPGVLLGATARPLWINGHSLGALFLAVGASTAAAAMALILSSMGGRAAEALGRLRTMMVLALVVQVAAVVVFIFSVRASGSPASLQALTTLLSGQFSMMFWGGAIVVGSLVPLAIAVLGMRRQISPGLAALVSLLVLVGGFLTKYSIMAAGQL